MSLCINDTIALDGEPTKYFRVKKLEATNNNIVFQPLEAGGSDLKDGLLNKTPNSLKARKVIIDYLGNVTSCYD